MSLRVPAFSCAFALVVAHGQSALADTVIDHDVTYAAVTFPDGVTTIMPGVTVTLLTRPGEGARNYVAQGDTLVNHGTIVTPQSFMTNFGTFENHGTFSGSLDNGVFQGGPYHYGTFVNHGTFVGSLDNSIHGKVVNHAGAVFSDNGFGINWGTFDNAGYFESWNYEGNDWLGFHNSYYFGPENWGIEATFTNTGSLVILAGGRFTAAASTVVNDGTIVVQGELSAQSFAYIDNSGTIENYASLDNQQCTLISDGTIVNYGHVYNGHTITNSRGSWFDNLGTIDNHGSLETYGPSHNDGTIDNWSIFTNRARCENEGAITNHDRFDNFGFTDQAGELVNTGTFTNAGAARTAYVFDNYGSLINAAGATFSSLNNGVVINRCDAVLENAGSFTATLDDYDADHDELCKPFDNCPLVANADQANRDGDGQGDACDACPDDPDNDRDHDGKCGDVDNCPAVANATQLNADGDGLGDACDACPLDADNDIDGDGDCGNVDNCPLVANADQLDTDADGLGDACDDDDDDDGLSDTLEAQIGTNPLVVDSDGDGLGDALEYTAGGGGCPSPTDADSDDDTLSDGAELAAGIDYCNPDTDGDGVRDDDDPLPAEPGVTQGWLVENAAELSADVASLSLPLFLGNNQVIRADRRQALADLLDDAASDIAAGDLVSATSLLQSALKRVDGVSPQPDWMAASAERDAVAARIRLFLSLIALDPAP